jgi:hypothetical protein
VTRAIKVTKDHPVSVATRATRVLQVHQETKVQQVRLEIKAIKELLVHLATRAQ